MSKKYRLAFATLLTLVVAEVVLIISLILRGHNLGFLSPKGLIASQQRDLMVIAALLSFIIVIPVFGLTFFIAWRYREGNKKAKYAPEWDHSRLLEFSWWAIPGIIILVLSVITWNSSHALDPRRPLTGAKPLPIQVVALQWKWLFIYPEQQIASVNYVQFPVDRPVAFEITADAPMNAFWIPRLGSQVYAMTGMSARLHLVADEAGEYQGASANLSGEGFAGMRFVAQASSEDGFETWVQSVKNSSERLNWHSYRALAEPSHNHPPVLYAFAEPGLYNAIVAQFKNSHQQGKH